MTAWRLTFGGFSLDLASDRLSRGHHAVPLVPRDLAVLRCLAVRRGQIVSTDEILEAVWGDLFVTRAVVKVSIHRIRAALGDTTEQPRIIETVGRKGYRFIAPIERARDEAHDLSREDARSHGVQDAELAWLRVRFERARGGRRQVVFLTEEVVAETTALVDALLDAAGGPGEAVCAVGCCVEQLGPREPYFALFDAMRSLCRGPLAAEVLTLLRRHAPLWLAQLPEFVPRAAREALTRESESAAPERMVREFASAVEALGALRPLVLVLRHLEWSHPATLDVLSVIAQPRGPARLLAVATFGPGAPAPARSLRERLLERGVAEELAIPSVDACASVEMAAADASVVDFRARLARAPFVGRVAEQAQLVRRLDAVKSGSGGLVLVAGEPGIGKTRLLAEVAVRAEAAGARVLTGRCFEDALGRPYGPFAEAVVQHVQSCDTETLRQDVARSGGVVARIAPELHDHLPDLSEPAALEPEQERHRLLDAVAQLLWAVTRRSPVLLVLDDLQWADGGTLALLRHLARFLPRRALLILGAYRDVELGAGHPLTDALAAVRHELDVESIALSGLDRNAATELVKAIANEPIPAELVEALAVETGGNPLFLRETLLHLLEERRRDPASSRGPWRFSIDAIGVPDGVREVIGRRLSRLPEAANRLLAAASGYAGPFRLDVVAAVADLEEDTALDALDAALAAQLVRATDAPEVYEFTHALIRHSLYGDLNPSRRVRLHRRLAREIERLFAPDLEDHVLEIAQQWHRSAALPGAEHGVRYCLLAADRAERSAAHEEAAAALRMALDLAPAGDERRARLLARLGIALAWSLAHEEAVRVASEAGELLAQSEDSEAAADYFADVADAVYSSTFDRRAWPLAAQGLRHVGRRRDLTWARLAALDLDFRDAADSTFPGIPLDTAERHEVSRVLVANWPWLTERGVVFSAAATAFDSRGDASERGGASLAIVGFWAGEYGRALALASTLLTRFLERGQLAAASMSLLSMGRWQLAQGNAAAAGESWAQALQLVDRLGNPPFLRLQMGGFPLERASFLGEGYDLLLPGARRLLAEGAPENRWIEAMVRASMAFYSAHAGRADDALHGIAAILPAIERAAGWAPNYTAIVWLAIEALWVIGRADFAEPLERNLRTKTLAPDFRYTQTDARLALARICTLTGRFDEARSWFNEARRVLGEQGARPLRAVADFDEARMEVLRGARADRMRALKLLAAARHAFEALEMPGWLRRAHALQRELEMP